jgi:hypothetical protein
MELRHQLESALSLLLDARALVRLYKDLIDERTGPLQPVHATLLHHGVPAVGGSLMTAAGRERVTSADLPGAGRCAVDTGMRQVARFTEEMLPLRRQIVAIGACQPGLPGPPGPLRHRRLAVGCDLGGTGRLPSLH